MGRFVVLLRGVNVGKGNRLPMADFKALLQGLGHSGVRTLLNSGNAVFDSPARSTTKLADAIADALTQQCRLKVPVVVLSARQFEAVVADCPAPPSASEQARFVTVFTRDAAALKALASIRPLLQPAERFDIGAHAAYLHCAGGLLDSAAAAALLKVSDPAVTTRNWATVLKLAALVEADRA